MARIPEPKGKHPPIAQLVKLEVFWQGPNGTKAANIFHAWTSAQLTTLSQFQKIASNLDVALFAGGTGLGPLMGPLWSCTSIAATDLSGLSETTGYTAGSTVGTATGDTLPPNVAAGVGWTIPASYRGGHPRTYQPGPPESGLASPGSNVWSTAFKNSLKAFWGNFLTNFSTGLITSITEELVVPAYYRNHVALANPTWYPVTGGTIHSRMDTQRRRLGKESNYP